MKNTLETRKTYEVTFNDPMYNTLYHFTRKESSLAQYGNHTCVIVHHGKMLRECVDTRYDQTVTKDFGAWCEAYLANAFDTSFEPKWRAL